MASQPGRVAPKSDTGNTKKSPPCEDSGRLIIFVLRMYKQLISEQRSQIFALLQRKCPRKDIARIVGISQSTLSRELKRNSTRSGKYIWFKAHAKAVERRKRSARNAALAPELVWRIKQLIIEEQWSPRQISGVLKKEGVSVSHQSIYNLIHADVSEELAHHTRHKLITKYLGAVVYFADPYASWQKGAIENTNKLIRQYIPKQANFDDFTDKKMASIQKKINSILRQKLKFETPKAEFFKRIA